MKRISKKRKTQKLREDTLKQLRQTRKKLQKDHPDLFAAIQKLVKKASEAEEAGKNQEKPREKASDDEAEMVQIDKKKNLEAILKYAALKPESQKLKKELKDFLN